MKTLSNAKSNPIPFDPDRGSEAAALFADQSENIRALIAGVAGSSPYLHTSLMRESDWLASKFTLDVSNVIQAEIRSIAGTDFTSLARGLRIAKRRIALMIALADLGGIWSLSEVTEALTDFADASVQTALTYLVGEEIRKGKLPNCSDKDLPDCAGLVAIAMGKMGAHELNYSSDIDLIMVFDETRHDPDTYAEVRAAFIRVTQRMVKMLSENTGDGYVFRTDLRLRPDASVTPVCMAMEPAENYYESFGRTWERAAFIKARVCAGDVQAGNAFLDRLKPFIWRKYLDFAAIQDAHDMRLRIREHKGLHGEIQVPGHNMKLGQGGIREIEFFTQTRQIICGGRDKSIRQSQTLSALRALAENGWIEPAVAESLTAAYIHHRTIEHRIQMLDDAQTHIYPDSDEKRLRIANLCGVASPADIEPAIEKRLRQVNDLTEKLYANESSAGSDEIELTESAATIVDKWNTLPALRSERAQQIFARLKPDLLARLTEKPDSDDALLHFDRFLGGLPAGVQIFSLFEANPQLLDLFVDICATAPALASYLGQNTHVLDAFVSQDFFKQLPSLGDLITDLKQDIHPEDYEANLDIVRRWVKEQKFKVGVHLLRAIATPEEAALDYSNIAEAALRVLFPEVCRNFSKRYGPPPGRGATVIAMGKLGSREMTATSDLDLIIIYDAQGVEQSDGPKELAVSTYFARLTQAVLSALTVPTAEGALYEVDMRLRPSGRQGPVATALKAFRTYQLHDAWTWEHLALLRARVIGGDASLVKDVETSIYDALTKPRDMSQTLADISEMRKKLLEAKNNDDPWQVKDGAGRLSDIEMLCQAGALTHGLTDNRRPIDALDDLVIAGWLSQEEATALAEGHQIYSRIQHLSRVSMIGPLKPDTMSKGLEKLLCAATHCNNLEDLASKLTNVAILLTQIIRRKI